MDRIAALTIVLLLESSAWAGQAPKDCSTQCKEAMKNFVELCKNPPKAPPVPKGGKPMPKLNPAACVAFQAKFSGKCVSDCEKRRAEKARGQR